MSSTTLTKWVIAPQFLSMTLARYLPPETTSSCFTSSAHNQCAHPTIARVAVSVNKNLFISSHSPLRVRLNQQRLKPPILHLHPTPEPFPSYSPRSPPPHP